MPKKEIPEAMERAKAKCGITHFSKRQIRNLSGGYQQRVGIAQAIIHNPLFVILDEPTNGLDPNQIMEVRRLIQEIAKDRAVLISTHILPEVQAVCDYIMMIEHGQKVFEGTINAFNTYMSPSALLTIMHNAPSSEELMKIEGVERVERLTNTRIRLHFKGDDSIIRRVVEQAVRINGIYGRFLWRRSPWIRCLPNCPERSVTGVDIIIRYFKRFIRMRTIIRITKSELRVLFFSPIAWLILIVFSFQVGMAYSDTLALQLKNQELGYRMFAVTSSLLCGYTGIFPICWRIYISIFRCSRWG